MWETINKEYIANNNFESDKYIDDKPVYKPAYYGKGEVQLPTVDENDQALRDAVQNLCWDVIEEIRIKEGKRITKRELVEERCLLSTDLIKRFIKGTRVLERIDLGRLCIGCKLTLEQAQELFALHKNGELRPTQVKEDAIIVDALKCGDDIDTFCLSCYNNGVELKDR